MNKGLEWFKESFFAISENKNLGSYLRQNTTQRIVIIDRDISGSLNLYICAEGEEGPVLLAYPISFLTVKVNGRVLGAMDFDIEAFDKLLGFLEEHNCKMEFRPGWAKECGMWDWGI
jgi:hypothetical protein